MMEGFLIYSLDGLFLGVRDVKLSPCLIVKLRVDLIVLLEFLCFDVLFIYNTGTV